jgi:cyclophilin family peptidyl-prolyl cis-trans isomerase/HEAT repeat protein
MKNATAKLAGRPWLCVFCVFCGCLLSVADLVFAQTRVAILQAEDRRAATANDLAVLRAGARSDDAQTRRMAIRAIGRLERPALIPDLTPQLRHALPEVRAEAANAIGQAAQGWKADRTSVEARALTSALATLVARLRVEAEPDVRSALCETIGRLPYLVAADVEQAERALVAVGGSADTIADRLGVAKGFESLARVVQKIQPLGPESIALLRRLVVTSGDSAGGARIRRLAVEALVTANALDAPTLRAAASDADAQVRREAVRAAALPARDHAEADVEIVRAALTDVAPMVRFEALRGRRGDCDATVAATRDRDMHVVLLAFDELAACGESADALATLERTLDDLSDVGLPRAWHRSAHALVALASAQPARAAAKLPPFKTSRVWQLRLYAARAAAVLKDRTSLDALASTDEDDNVREAAVEGLTKIAGHDADEVYIANLSRPGYQVIRAAALALVGTTNGNAASALGAARQRLIKEGRDNSHDARAAIERALNIRSTSDRQQINTSTPSDVHRMLELPRRLASPRARIAIRGVGTFELALFMNVAPLTVLKFVQLAESGYYNGLTFHRVVPNFVIQGGSPGANEYIGDASFMRDEVSLWPHVRGAVGISTRGHDTGDAQFFVDLVDNPRLDHVYTVFAQVLNGMDVVDQILEGDVIERIDIVT